MAEKLTAKVLLDIILKDAEARKALNSLNAELKKLRSAVGGVGTEAKKTSTDIKKEFDKAGKPVKKFGRTMNQVSRDFIRDGDAMIRVAKGMTIFLAAPMLAASAAAIKFSSDFEHSFAEVRTILTATADETDVLNSRLRSLATEVPQSLNELTRGLYQTISSGITDTTQALIVLEQAAKAAVAGVTDTFTAVDALTTVINAYKLSAADAERVSDILFTTVRLGKVVFPELAHSLGKVISTASLGKVPFEEVAAAMAVLTKNGIKADMASISLNQAMLAFISPSKQAKDAALKYGVELNASALSAGGLIGALQQLNKLMVEVEKEGGDSIEVFGEIATNVRALRAVASLAGKSFEEFVKTIAMMHDSAGATNDAFAIMEDTMKNRLVIAVQSMQLAMITFGETLAPVVELFSKFVTVLGGVLAFGGHATGFILGLSTVLVSLATVFVLINGLLRRTIGVMQKWIAEKAKAIVATKITTETTKEEAAAMELDTIAKTKNLRVTQALVTTTKAFAFWLSAALGALILIGGAFTLTTYLARKKREELEQIRLKVMEYAQEDALAAEKEYKSAGARADAMDILRKKYLELKITREELGETNAVLDAREATLELEFRKLVGTTVDLKDKTYDLESAYEILNIELHTSNKEVADLQENFNILQRELISVRLVSVRKEYSDLANDIEKVMVTAFHNIEEETSAMLRGTYGVVTTNLPQLVSGTAESISKILEVGITYEQIVDVMKTRNTEAVDAQIGANEDVRKSFDQILDVANQYYNRYLSLSEKAAEATREEKKVRAELQAGVEGVTAEQLALAIETQKSSNLAANAVSEEILEWNKLIAHLRQVGQSYTDMVDLSESFADKGVGDIGKVVNAEEDELRKREAIKKAMEEFNDISNRTYRASKGGTIALIASMDKVKEKIDELKEGNKGLKFFTGQTGGIEVNKELAELEGKLKGFRLKLAADSLKMDGVEVINSAKKNGLLYADVVLHYDKVLELLNKHYADRKDLITKATDAREEAARLVIISSIMVKVNAEREKLYTADAATRLTISQNLANAMLDIELVELSALDENTEKSLKKRQQAYSNYVEAIEGASAAFSAERRVTDERATELLVQHLKAAEVKFKETYGDTLPGILELFNQSILKAQSTLATESEIALLRITSKARFGLKEQLEGATEEWEFYVAEIRRLDAEQAATQKYGEAEFLKLRSQSVDKLIALEKKYTRLRKGIFEEAVGPFKQLIQSTYDVLAQHIFSFMQEQQDWNEAQHQLNLLNIQDEEQAIRQSYLNREVDYERYQLQLRALDDRRRAEMERNESAHQSWLARGWNQLKDTYGSVLARILSDYLYMATVRLAMGKSLSAQEVLTAQVTKKAVQQSAAAKSVAIATKGTVQAGASAAHVPFPFTAAAMAQNIAAATAMFAPLLGFATGVIALARGGIVHGPGTPTSDSIPTRLSDGEFVVNAGATKRNRGLLEAINRSTLRPSGAKISGGMAMGGIVKKSLADDSLGIQRLLSDILNILEVTDFAPKVSLAAETNITARGLQTLVKKADREEGARRIDL